MASVIALRALVGAGLGLGALDVVWINAALAPQLDVHARAPTPAVALAAAPQPSPEPDPAPAPAPAPVPALAAQPAAPIAPVTPVASETKRVYFATSSAARDARARNALAGIAAHAAPSAVFALEGHADPRGPEALNENLSKDRALAVEQQLVKLGIERTRIHVGYVGERDASAVLWRDRRVDIQITGAPR